MSRDRVESGIVVVLCALWAMCAIASAVTIQRGSGFPPFYITADGPGGSPVVSGFRSRRLGGTSGDLRPGDRLLRLDAIDVSNDGPATLFVRFVQLARDGDPVEVVFERDGTLSTTIVVPSSTRIFAPLLFAAPVFAIVAFLLRRRAAGNAAARAFSLALANLAFYLAANFTGSPAVTWAAAAVHIVTVTLVGPLLVRAFLLFPDRSHLRPAERRWPWLFAILGLLHTAHLGTPVPPRPGNAAAALVVVALLLVCAALATRAYRRATPLGRRRVKWLLLGTYVSAMPPLAAALLSVVDPRFINVYFLSLAAIAALPLSLLIAIVRVNLFDVDRILSTTGSYNLLIGGGVILGVTVVPRAAQAGAALLGIDSDVGQLGLSGILGLGIYYAHGHLRPRIERLFFAERYALDVGVHELVARMRQSADLETLVGEIADSLTALIRPDSCVIYARRDGSYLPLVAQAPVVPPALTLEGPLLATLRDRRRPLALIGEDESVEASLDPFERAALQTLEAEVIVPIWRGDALELLLCLGAKASGDVYTSTDVRQLMLVGETASFCLEHFAQSAVIAQTRQMRDALRRYIPTSVAEAMDQGEKLEPVESDVTVMFVDLRGYTALCEPMAPQQVLDFTAKYTATASEVLRNYGGNLVEFSGDGLMAVFGAPKSLEHKENAAVRAGFELVDALHSRGPQRPDGKPLGVGIGIATGTALCGNIRSADRLIWTAVGNIVNLAARLQNLTRELGALMAIDLSTFERAGSATADFERSEEIHIRGRSQPQVIYTLPLPPTAAGWPSSAAASAAT